MKKLLTEFRRPLILVLILIPISAVAGIFTALYQLDIYPEEMFAEAIAQLGGTGVLIAITAVQSVGYAVFCGFFGDILASRTGLIKPFKFERRIVVRVTAISLICGAALYFCDLGFGALMPEMSAGFEVSADASLKFSGIAAALLYGGIIEEVMMRLFVMSLVVFAIWKLLYRKSAEIPNGIYIAANLISALLFAAGHLPANAMIFGTLTPLVILRCMLLNAFGGVVFGEFYRRHGLHYSMLSHMLFHVGVKICTAVMLLI